jgi:nitrate ABC transporter ATP-binding subunit
MSKTFLDISFVSKAFSGPTGSVTVVRDFDLKVRRGEFIALIGHSGCGKSTVLSMVAGLTETSDGAIFLDGKEVTGAGPDRGVVFQAPCLLPWRTAYQNVRLGVDQVFYTATKPERDDITRHYLCLVGLGDALNKYPAELSQGMRQRVGIARAFALRPKMLLLDEPFGMLDSLTRFELQQVLLDLWQRDQKTALMVTHDVDEAIFLADRVVMMTNGPEAGVGEILEISFPRPRNRKALLEDAFYYKLREEIIGFLNERSHLKPTPATPPTAQPPADRSDTKRPFSHV